MKKYLMLFALLSFLLTNAQYKKGIIYLKDGNTPEGLIKTRALGGVKYKANKDSETKLYDYNNITGYDITEHGSVKYRYKKVGDFYRLMKVVRLGRINLYSVFISNEVKNKSFVNVNPVLKKLPVSSGNIYYTEKKGVTVRIGNKIKKGKLYLFEDCPVLLEKIKKKEFKKSDIYKIINFYNMSCK